MKSIDQRFVRPLGALCLLASDPMIEAGVMAARSFAQEGDYVRLTISWISIAAAVLLLVAGVLLCFKRHIGRTLAFVSTGVSVPVCIFSATIGLMGGHALLYGVGYPVAIVLMLKRATPSNGLTAGGEHPASAAASLPDDTCLRATMA